LSFAKIAGFVPAYALVGGPVVVVQFAANSENNSEFLKFCPFWAIGIAGSLATSVRCASVPYDCEQ
jgi:hypothetical protein